MGQLTPEQRRVLYVQEATRSGVHKAILAALHQVQAKPTLADGETGLGIAPAHQIELAQVDTFVAQVQYAANTIRSLTNRLTLHGWNSEALWDAEQGRYTDKFVQTIAAGYSAPATDSRAALLEASDPAALLAAYLSDLSIDAQTVQLPLTFAFLDTALLAFLKPLPHCYFSLPHQRHALLEAVRLWCQVDTHAAAIASLNLELANTVERPMTTIAAEDSLDPALLHFVPLMTAHYAGYPQQREALLRLTQLWQQLESREVAIIALAHQSSPALNVSSIDAALIAIVQRLPQSYDRSGEQRHALVEAFRLWQQIDSRSDALIALGVDPAIFTGTTPNQTAITNAAVQLDQALLNFIYRLPATYEGTAVQRDALLHLTQLWRSLTTPEQAVQSLLHDLTQMAVAQRDTPEAPPVPLPLLPSTMPDRWTHATLQLDVAIIPNGSFTWADATSGGTQMPTNQTTVDAIVRLADRIQQVRDRLSRPLHITTWYLAAPISNTDPLSRQHQLGDTLTFYCQGLTGNQLYWFLDPWWTGGLGYHTAVPYLCSVNAGSDRTRWRR
ncbi:MAG: peptidase M15A [Stenomitos frigidus ULC029]